MDFEVGSWVVLLVVPEAFYLVVNLVYKKVDQLERKTDSEKVDSSAARSAVSWELLKVGELVREMAL